MAKASNRNFINKPLIQNIKPMDSTKSVSEMTTLELETYLKSKKKKEALKYERDKKKYETKRDKSIEEMVTNALEIASIITVFKEDCHKDMDSQSVELANYGKMRSNSKGGFSITNTEDTMRITRRRDTIPTWDERSSKAVELIKDFLGDAIKKKNAKLFEILMSFLERNKNGDLEYARVMDLYSHENKFDDPRWKEGLRLIKESFHNHFKGFGYEFKTKDKNGKWQTVLLNFSSL